MSVSGRVVGEEGFSEFHFKITNHSEKKTPTLPETNSTTANAPKNGGFQMFPRPESPFPGAFCI